MTRRGEGSQGSSYRFSELQENPSLAIDFIIAPPRMAYYMEYSTRIYQVYMKYVAPEDIIVYSIDEGVHGCHGLPRHLQVIAP